MPVLLIIAFLSALAVAIHAIGAAFDGLAAGLAALPQDHEQPLVPPAEPAVVAPPMPAAIAGETYARFFARTGAAIVGPDGHEISDGHVFDGDHWAPQAV